MCYPQGDNQSYTNYLNGNKLASPKINNASCNDNDLYNLLKKGPVSVVVDANPIFHYSGGIFDGACSKITHAVIAVGYGLDPNGIEYWIVRNSWAATWGENGYIRIKRNLANNNSCFLGAYYVQPQI